MATPRSDRGAGDLTMYQWNIVLDKLLRHGLLSEVDPDTDLLDYLTEGGLSDTEKQLVLSEQTTTKRMSRLEPFLRTRPSLQKAFRKGLAAGNSPLLQVLDNAATDCQKANIGEDPEERFRGALRQYDTAIATLGQWAVPLLRNGCLTMTDEDDYNAGRRRLSHILANKSIGEWTMFIEFLEEHQKDLHVIFKPLLEHQGTESSAGILQDVSSAPEIPQDRQPMAPHLGAGVSEVADVSTGRGAMAPGLRRPESDNEDTRPGGPTDGRRAGCSARDSDLSHHQQQQQPRGESRGGRSAAPAAAVHFRVENCGPHRDGDDFECDLGLPVPARGAELRAALAKEMAARAAELRLVQIRARTQGGGRPAVWCRSRNGDAVYVDAEGRRHNLFEMERRQFISVDDDEELILGTAADLWNFIRVFQQ